jgi:hypothetical protein
MYLHGEPSEGFLMVVLSSEEEDAFPDTSRDEEITRKLVGNLNRGLLGPPNDDRIVILSDFEDEEEVVLAVIKHLILPPTCPNFHTRLRR